MSSKGKMVALIQEGCHFEGHLSCRGVATISGEVSGRIFSDDTLIITEGAIVNADIHGHIILIAGTVKGNIKATARVEIKKPARFEGTIMSPGLVVEEGVIFHGTTKMQDKSF